MEIGEFKRRLDAISGDHGLEILMLLRKRGWSIALEVATELNIHSTSAMRYLSKMHKVGFLERRTRKCKTGSTHEYKLAALKISLELDLTEEVKAFEDLKPVFDLIIRIAGMMERVGNPVTAKSFKSEREFAVFRSIVEGKGGEALASEKDGGQMLPAILQALVEFSEKSLGKTFTRDLLVTASKALPDSFVTVMPEHLREVFA